MRIVRVVLAAFVVCNVESTTIYWNGTCPIIVDGTCPDNYVNFTLFTSSKPAGQTLDVAANNIAASGFNPANPTKIIIHGYADSPTGTPLVIQKAYVSEGNINVIMVDWSFLAQLPCYQFAVVNIRHTGQCTGQLIQLLRQNAAVDIHVIGHSLGAQAANFVAQNVSPKLPRISGLDPAGPLFPLGTPLDSVLDKSDATFVDVYHTNDNLFGKMDPSGHVDFYFNGGTYQPGCPLDVSVDAVLCSHCRAVTYFAESIQSPRGFYGKSTADASQPDLRLFPDTSPPTVLAGEMVDKRTTGIVAVTTASTAPYALGK